MEHVHDGGARDRRDRASDELAGGRTQILSLTNALASRLGKASESRTGRPNGKAGREEKSGLETRLIKNDQ